MSGARGEAGCSEWSQGEGVDPEDVALRVQTILSQSRLELSPREMLKFIDLTLLDPMGDEAAIGALCQRAQQVGVAAVCVHPQFAPMCREGYPDLPLAVVGSHFPWGEGTVSELQTREAMELGVDEVDMVLNWPWVHQGKLSQVFNEIHRLARACEQGQVVLKVILESGEVADWTLLRTLSRLSIEAGAGFLKTSTGKTAVGATLPGAYVMLASIRESGRPVGFKPSGGLRSYQDVLPYFQLTAAILGEQAITPQRFRIGASSLVDELFGQ